LNWAGQIQIHGVSLLLIAKILVRFLLSDFRVLLLLLFVEHQFVLPYPPRAKFYSENDDDDDDDHDHHVQLIILLLGSDCSLRRLYWSWSNWPLILSGKVVELLATRFLSFAVSQINLLSFASIIACVALQRVIFFFWLVNCDFIMPEQRIRVSFASDSRKLQLDGNFHVPQG
jgi:hypothetical protein